MIVRALWHWLVTWINLAGKIESLESTNLRMERELREVGERVAVMEARLSSIETRTTRLEGQLWEVYGTVREHQGRLQGLPPRYPDAPPAGAGEAKS